MVAFHSRLRKAAVSRSPGAVFPAPLSSRPQSRLTNGTPKSWCRLPRPAVLAPAIQIDERHAEELVLDRADCRVGVAVGGEIHPTVVQERRRGHARARGARMLIAIQFLQHLAGLFQ